MTTAERIPVSILTDDHTVRVFWETDRAKWSASAERNDDGSAKVATIRAHKTSAEPGRRATDRAFEARLVGALVNQLCVAALQHQGEFEGSVTVSLDPAQH